MDVNLNNEFNKIIKKINFLEKPNLFLHVCCAPCSSAVFEKLYKYFNIYVIFHNPNIDTISEFTHRKKELYKLIDYKDYKINILYENYNHKEFINSIIGFEDEKEGGKRCEICFKIRLHKSYEIAKDYIINNNLLNSTNYLCSTLSISPHKNAKLIYNIGKIICDNYNFPYITYLPSDFKKENGYLRSIEISKELGLYRQDYCGCEFAKYA